MKIWITDNTIDEVRKLNQIDGTTHQEEEFDERDRLLNGFGWRDDERPRSIADLFIDDPPLKLPVIKGLEEYKPQEEFFDSELLERADQANTEAEDIDAKTTDKASRNIPKNKQDFKNFKPTKLKRKDDN